MASITTHANGRRSIQFVSKDGRRRTIRLGKVPMRTAEAIKVRVEQLNAAAIAGHPVEEDASRWLATVGDGLAEKLTAVGLIPKRDTATLESFLAAYIAERGSDAKPRTLISLGSGKRNLIAFFGPDVNLKDITPAAAHDFRTWLVADQKLSQPTISKRISLARQFFTAAGKRRLVGENPFADVRIGPQTNAAKQRYIERETITQVIAACPGPHWKLLFALARYAGLRVPSETTIMRWGDIDWARGRMVVHSPKTEHHDGGDCRIVPIFPEVLPHLEAAYDLAAEGEEFVFPRCWHFETNLRTQATRLIKRAGVVPWPKMFINLRASAATDLAGVLPSHVACAWLGHSERIANRHYRQVVDGDFEKAQQAFQGGAAKSDAPGAQNALQKPMQQPAAVGRNESQSGTNFDTSINLPRPLAIRRKSLLDNKIAEAGIEPARG